MKERYEKKSFEWFISRLFMDYWHLLRYYYVSPEDCPRCQANESSERDGTKA